MQAQNLDLGVRRALVAYFKERGDAQEAAETKADANLQAACDYIKEQVAAVEVPENYTKTPQADQRYRWSHGFAALKTWALANVA